MKNNNTDKYFYLSQNKDFGLMYMHYSENELLDFEQAIKEYVESGCTKEAYKKQAEYGYSDVLDWHNGTITTNKLFDMVKAEWEKELTASVEITAELRQNVYDVIATCGTTYDTGNATSAFTRNEFEAVVNELKADVYDYLLACGSSIIYNESGKPSVDPEAVEALLDPELIEKTIYVIEERRSGHHIDLIDFDEWVAISNVLNLPEISFEDALSVNSILWKYDVTPLELEPSKTKEPVATDKTKKAPSVERA